MVWPTPGTFRLTPPPRHPKKKPLRGTPPTYRLMPAPGKTSCSAAFRQPFGSRARRLARKASRRSAASRDPPGWPPPSRPKKKAAARHSGNPLPHASAREKQAAPRHSGNPWAHASAASPERLHAAPPLSVILPVDAGTTHNTKKKKNRN